MSTHRACRVVSGYAPIRGGRASTAVVLSASLEHVEDKHSTAVVSGYAPTRKSKDTLPLPYFVFRLRRMTATIRIPQKTKKTVDAMKTGTQPMVKTSVRASAVTMPPPMKGS